MMTWLRDVLDAVLLRGAAFARIVARPDAFLRGLLVILAVALVAGLPTLVIDLVRGFEPPATIEPSELRPSVDLVPWLRTMGVPDAIAQQMVDGMDENALLGATIASQVQGLPTTLPRPLAQGMASIGRWLSQPFAPSPIPLVAASLATWLGYGIWVMLAAKLLGGRGTLAGFFGATGFFAAPHILSIFGRVPVAGGILAAVGVLWGLVIYVLATAVSHRLSAGRAVVAVFAPLIVLLLLGALMLFGFTLVLVALGLAAQ
jgi:hypothetical protein